jgi:hypothetical protein
MAIELIPYMTRKAVNQVVDNLFPKVRMSKRVAEKVADFVDDERPLELVLRKKQSYMRTKEGRIPLHPLLCYIHDQLHGYGFKNPQEDIHQLVAEAFKPYLL